MEHGSAVSRWKSSTGADARCRCCSQNGKKLGGVLRLVVKREASQPTPVGKLGRGRLQRSQRHIRTSHILDNVVSGSSDWDHEPLAFEQWVRFLSAHDHHLDATASSPRGGRGHLGRVVPRGATRAASVVIAIELVARYAERAPSGGHNTR